MSEHHMQRFCKTCGAPRRFVKPGVNHILHFFLSLFTAGLWLLVWILLICSNAASSYRCTQCGQSKLL